MIILGKTTIFTASAIAFALAASGARAASQTYHLDPDHTRVSFG